MNLSKLEAPGIGIVVGVVVFLIINVAAGRPILPDLRPVEPSQGPVVVDLDPSSLYATNCNVCHQAAGEGLPNTFPPLAGSEWVVQDPETPIRVILCGLTGEIEVAGATYNAAMPAQAQLNDEQIALLVNHIRSSFGNEPPEGAEPVDAALVASVRAEISGRSGPLTAAELAAARAP